MRRLFSIVTVALLLTVGPQAEALGKDRLKLARSQAAKAEKMVEKSEYVGAERLFRNAISIEPLLPTAYLGLGKALVGQQRYAEALDVLEQAEQRYVEWEQAVQIGDLTKRVVAERQLQSIEDVRATISGRNSASSRGSSQPGQVGIGQLTPEKIQTEQFLFRNHRELEGFHAIPAQVFYLEGISYLRTNQRTKGIEALRVCLLTNRRHYLAHYNLAVALFTQGEFDEAKTHLDSALKGGVEPHGNFVADLDLALGSRLITGGQ